MLCLLIKYSFVQVVLFAARLSTPIRTKSKATTPRLPHGPWAILRQVVGACSPPKQWRFQAAIDEGVEWPEVVAWRPRTLETGVLAAGSRGRVPVQGLGDEAFV